jgi:anaerobic magnesium-protoporphyrin IX monomethyl ester cyclase
MKRVGVHTLAYGLESAALHVLRRIGKPLDLEQVEEAIRIAQQAGIEVELFSQYGLPGETFEDALRTLTFVKHNGVRVRGNTNAQQMQVYFGTQIQQESDRFGILPFQEPFPPYLSIGSRYRTEWMRSSEIEEVGRLWKDASEDGGKHIVS